MGRRPSTPSDPAEQPGVVASREGSQAAQSTPINAHAWQREVHEHYVEPHWCSERLFAEEKFEGPIWDPCCGFGRIPDAAKKADLEAIGTDITYRGWLPFCGKMDFLSRGRLIDTKDFDIVCNPPFNIAGKFARHAIDMDGVEAGDLAELTSRARAALLRASERELR